MCDGFGGCWKGVAGGGAENGIGVGIGGGGANPDEISLIVWLPAFGGGRGV